MKKNLTSYDILSVSPEASQSDIHAAYKKLAKAWHPDRQSNQAQRAIADRNFKLLQEAYNNVKTPQARSRYNHQLAISNRAILIRQDKVINDNKPVKSILDILSGLFR